jgi:hypothetical protein
MKNNIDEIIASFTPEELKSFKYFLKRNGPDGEKRMDLKLLEIIKRGEEYDKTQNAIRQIRKRLKKQLEIFVAFENQKQNETSQIINQIEVAKYLFRKNLHKQAWDYLIKAELRAVESEKYELLSSIYNIQVSYASTVYMPSSYAPGIEGILNKQANNHALAKTDNDANAAYGILLLQIRKLLTKEVFFDANQLAENIFKQFGLYTTIHVKPRIYFKMVSTVCRALLESKDYEKLKPYAIKNYRFMEEQQLLKKIDLDSLLELFKIIIDASFRTGDYETSEKFVGLMQEQINSQKVEDEKYQYYQFYAIGFGMELYIATDRLEEASATSLLLHKRFGEYKESARIYFILRINMMAIAFMRQEYEKAFRFYNEMMRQNQSKLLDIGGVEILLYTEIYGVMIQVELDDQEYALHMLSTIKRRHAEVLNQKLKRESLFLSILERLIRDRNYPSSARFHTDHDKFIKLKSYIPGDKEYISFNGWLTSKLKGKRYYECFLDLIRGSREKDKVVQVHR